MVLRLRHEQICRPATLARSVAVKKKREGGYREEEYNPASHHYALRKARDATFKQRDMYQHHRNTLIFLAGV